MVSPQEPTPPIQSGPTATPPTSTNLRQKLASKLKFIIIGVVVLLILLATFIITGSLKKSSQNQPSSKTWELDLTYNNSQKVLSLKKLSLLDKQIRPDYRDQQHSPYNLSVLDSRSKVLYQTKINISEQIYYGIYYKSPPGQSAPESLSPEIETIIYIPYFENGTVININKEGGRVLKITVPGKESLIDPVQPVLAADDTNSCQPMKVVFISDNFTDLQPYHEFVSQIEDVYKSTPPYNLHPEMFDFETFDNTQPLGCQAGIVACMQQYLGSIEQIGRANYPDASKYILIINAQGSPNFNTPILGAVNTVGGDITVLPYGISYAGITQGDMMDDARHEFLGHAVGKLYDRYSLSPSAQFQTGDLLPGLRSNCTDSPTGEAEWQDVGVNSGYPSCIKPSRYAPTAPDCNTPGNPNLITGGSKQSVMSAIGCSQNHAFDPVENNWITKDIIGEYLQNCAASPSPSSEESPSPSSSSTAYQPSPSPSPAGSTIPGTPGPSGSPASKPTQTYECNQAGSAQAGKQLQLQNLSCVAVTPSPKPGGPIDFSAASLDWDDAYAYILSKCDISPECLGEVDQAINTELGMTKEEVTSSTDWPRVGSRVYYCLGNDHCRTEGFDHYDGTDTLPVFSPSQGCLDEFNSCANSLPNLSLLIQEQPELIDLSCDISDAVCTTNPALRALKWR